MLDNLKILNEKKLIEHLSERNQRINELEKRNHELESLLKN